jgi:septal ring factor EnvC (AmiA/AmiB activator)
MVWLMALPGWIKALAGAAVVIGMLQLQHWWTVRDLRKDIAKLEQALKDAQTEAAQFRVALADVQANRDRLESTIKTQNATIDAMSLRARQIEAAANLRVARALAVGKEEAAKLRLPTTTVKPGHQQMNAWIAERFGA